LPGKKNGDCVFHRSHLSLKRGNLRFRCRDQRVLLIDVQLGDKSRFAPRARQNKHVALLPRFILQNANSQL
jgi:hypothetical protein